MNSPSSLAFTSDSAEPKYNHEIDARQLLKTLDAELAAQLDPVEHSLSLASRPSALPGREYHIKRLKDLIFHSLRNRVPGSAYLCGVPGTGKTSSVHVVITELHAIQEAEQLPDFVFVAVNGLKISHPEGVYLEICNSMGLVASDTTARTVLNDFFRKGQTGKTNPFVILLLDELDKLLVNPLALVQLYELTTSTHAKLFLIAAANIVKMPADAPSKLVSRMGDNKILYNSYTASELEDIVVRRLCGADRVFDPDALHFIAVRIASIGGDARTMLSACSKGILNSLEILSSVGTLSGKYLVQEKNLLAAVVDRNFEVSRLSSTTFIARSLPLTQQLVLAITLRMSARGVSAKAETVYEEYSRVCVEHALPAVSLFAFLNCVEHLVSSQLVSFDDRVLVVDGDIDSTTLTSNTSSLIPPGLLASIVSG